MQLFTPVTIPKSVINISYNSKLMFIGSCFAENISKFFVGNKFNCLVNPSGIIYNPLSIRRLIDNIVTRKTYIDDDFFLEGNNFCSFDFHSSFAQKDKCQAVKIANKSISLAYDFLIKTDVLFITLGTAFVYFLKENGTPVSNCHKQNAEIFSRRLATIEELIDNIEQVVGLVDAINSKCRIVFTVSPIRHLKDGLHANRLSKSSLLVALHKVLERYDNCEYFPSYEIVEDELRDYRFYADDMIHVSKVAENIIWERICDTFFDNNMKINISRVEKFMLSVNHKIQDPNSPETIAFCKRNIELSQRLENEILGLDLSKERNYFASIVEYS